MKLEDLKVGDTVRYLCASIYSSGKRIHTHVGVIEVIGRVSPHPYPVLVRDVCTRAQHQLRANEIAEVLEQPEFHGAPDPTA